MSTVEWQLFDEHGFRKFIDRPEFRRFRDATWRMAPLPRAFCQLVAVTGCRISEALGLCGHQLVANGVVLRTLKRRRTVYRVVAIPPWLRKQLVELIGTLPSPSDRIFDVSRSTATRWVRLAMQIAAIGGKHATARGLRHGFGARGTMDSLPGHLLQQLLGHRDYATTEIYLHVFSPEAEELIARTWN